MKQLAGKWRFPVAFVSVAVLLLLFIPLKFSYSVHAPGKVISAREWILTKGTGGQLLGALIDHKRGVNESYSVSQFERGDAVVFTLSPNIATASPVAKGDTIGSIYSNEAERELIELEGQLQQARAALQLNKTGDKQALVEAAVREHNYAKQKSIEQEKILKRLSSLHERGLISQQEYEISASATRLNDINVEIAAAKVEAARSGEKPEQIALIESRILALEQQVRTSKMRLALFTLTSPIAGVVNRAFSSDTLLIVTDTTEYIVNMPVKWHDKKYIKTQQSVELNGPEFDRPATGTVLNLNRAVHNLNGQQFFIASALVEQETAQLVPGLMIDCAIACDKIGLLEYLKRVMH